MLRLTWLPLVLAFTAALGCGKKEDAAPAQASGTPNASSGKPSPFPEQSAHPSDGPGGPGGPRGDLVLPALPAAAAGKAYFVVRDVGVVAYDGKTFTPVTAIPERDRRFVNEVVRGGGGRLYVVGTSKIHVLEGDKATALPDEGMPMLSDHLVPGAGDELWLWSITQLGHYDGKAWTVLKADDLEPEGSFHGVAFDGKDTAWLATHKKLYRRVGDAWTEVAIEGFDGGLFSNLVTASTGVVYAVSSRGLVSLEGGKPTILKMPKERDGFSVKFAVRGPDGELALVTNNSDVSIFRPGAGGGFAIYTTRGATNLGYAGHAAVDAQGRVWVAADNALAVYQRGGKLTSYGPGTVAALNAGVKAVFVDGVGPALPAVGEIQRGTVKGQVLGKGGKAVEGARVAICASPRMMFRAGETPCVGQPHQQQTKTGADGAFVFAGVPLGTWGFAVLSPGEKKWSISFRDYCKGMQPGETCNAPLVLD